MRGNQEPEPREPSLTEFIELDIDIRIRSLIGGSEGDIKSLADALAEASTDEARLVVATAYVRAGYGRGYQDAMTDPPEENLFRVNNLEIPKPRPSITDR
jgi:hypothetical protein